MDLRKIRIMKQLSLKPKETLNIKNMTNKNRRRDNHQGAHVPHQHI